MEVSWASKLHKQPLSVGQLASSPLGKALAPDELPPHLSTVLLYWFSLHLLCWILHISYFASQAVFALPDEFLTPLQGCLLINISHELS